MLQTWELVSKSSFSVFLDVCITGALCVFTWAERKPQTQTERHSSSPALYNCASSAIYVHTGPEELSHMVIPLASQGFSDE